MIQLVILSGILVYLLVYCGLLLRGKGEPLMFLHHLVFSLPSYLVFGALFYWTSTLSIQEKGNARTWPSIGMFVKYTSGKGTGPKIFDLFSIFWPVFLGMMFFTYLF